MSLHRSVVAGRALSQSGPPISLGEAVTGLDDRNVGILLTTIRHAAGSLANRGAATGALYATVESARSPVHQYCPACGRDAHPGFPSNRGDFLIADSCNFAASSDYRTPVHLRSLASSARLRPATAGPAR